MAIMAVEGAEAVSGGESAAAAARAKRASKPRVRGHVQPGGSMTYTASDAGTATERRKEVLGTTKSETPAAPETSSSKAGKADKPKPPPPSRTQRAARTARRHGRSQFKSLAGKSSGGPLIAEYIAAVVILVMGSLISGKQKGYTTVMSSLIIRLSSLTAVFFVLFLLAGTKGGKSAVWFGALIDVAILMTATSENVIASMAKVIQGQPLEDTATLTAETDPNASIGEPAPMITIPDASVQTTQQTGTQLA
jgi:hypothetical protein